MAQKQLSFVVDHVLQKGSSETTIIDQLSPHANIFYIHTQTAHPIERYIARIEQSDVPNIVERRQLLLERAEHHRSNLINTEHQLDLGVPALTINTDDGYSPDLQTVITKICSSYSQS
jgi:hypothetical protein